MWRRSLSIRRFSSLSSYMDRTHTCGELTKAHEGQKVKIAGWLANRRMDKFLVLRDSYGTVQATVNNMDLKDLSYESVVQVEGVVRSRGDNVNPDMATGEIEIDVSSLKVLNKASTPLPLTPNKNSSEKTRLKYRYIDIRSNRMQRALRLRSRLVHEVRKFLVEKENFVDVETPTLFRRTPGGAAEFLVPASAPNLGSCYSLPQSPQQFKQLLMVGGIDRYFQIARCYRDEGSKGDRQPEFTQLDVEMSFISQEGIMKLIENVIVQSWPSDMDDLKPLAPFPRLRYDDVMRLYGSDKPDMRIDWFIQPCCRDLDFLRPATAGPDWKVSLMKCTSQAPNIKKRLIKEWRQLLTNTGPCANFEILTNTGKQWFKSVDNAHLMDKYKIAEDDAVIFCWGHADDVQWTMGQLRNMVATEGGLRKQRQITCHWVVDFPLFSIEDNKLVSTHHPFTAAVPEDAHLLDDPTQRHKIRGQHYDLVMNGIEMGGGSIRIHNSDLQQKVLDILNEDTSTMTHLLEALKYGAPPHGGFALGLDRYVALLLGEGDASVPVREVIAFPKTKDGKDIMSSSPAVPSKEECARYGFTMIPQEKEPVIVVGVENEK